MSAKLRVNRKKKIDWKNIRIGAIVAIVVGIAIGYYFFRKSEGSSEAAEARNKAHQDSIANIQISKLDSILIEANKQARDKGKIEDTLKTRFVDVMANLTHKYPNGWAAFYASYDRPVVYPFKALDMNDYISVDFVGAELERMGPDRYRLKLPDILDKKHFLNYHDNLYYFSGCNSGSQGIARINDIRLLVEALECNEQGLICVVGIEVKPEL